MIDGCIRDRDGGRCLFSSARRTAHALDRMRGLLGCPGLASEEALWLDPCSSVHTLFMQFPLDLAWLDRSGSVLKTVSHLAPWRFSACFRAAAVVEMPAGAVDRLGIHAGQQFGWETAAS